MINVLLVDDHELVRTGIRKILDEVKGLKVIGEAKTGEEAVQFCRKTEPNVVLMDMNMPGIGGLEATKKIIRYAPDVKVIVLTVYCEDPIPTKVMQIGAAGYLTKGAGPDEMINAIRAVNSGQRYITPEVAQKMALSQFKSVEENPFSSLSERELQHHSAVYGIKPNDELLVADLCSQKIIAADINDPLDKVLDAMIEKHLGSVVILLT